MILKQIRNGRMLKLPLIPLPKTNFIYLFGAVGLEHDLSCTFVVYLLVHTNVQNITTLIGQEQTNRNAFSSALYPATTNRRRLQLIFVKTKRKESDHSAQTM